MKPKLTERSERKFVAKFILADFSSICKWKLARINSQTTLRSTTYVAKASVSRLLIENE